MPALVKLTDSYESENVKVIGISIDYPEEIQSKILPFIKKHKINFNIIMPPDYDRFFLRGVISTLF